ncbi:MULTISPECIES: nitroreductase/quinone reductase family protein [unclassified Nocardia]|uniref:nitroreductase/quinone reductase family protein n=1 Tax=unclassified Nocardia TaxID=2637762 RepID=UPI0035D989DA
MSSPATSVQPAVGSRVQRTGDAFMRRLLRSPLHRMVSSKLLIVTVIGRKTGHVYENPVGYAQFEGQILIGTAARWHRNLRPGEPVRLTVRRQPVEADWEVIRDEETAAECYGIILEQNPTHGKFAKISLDPVGRVNRKELRAALDRGTVVVRLRPRKVLPDA